MHFVAAAVHWHIYAQIGQTALMCAAEFGRADCALLLLDAGADKSAASNVRHVGCL